MRAAVVLGVCGIAAMVAIIQVAATATTGAVPIADEGHHPFEWYPADLNEPHVQFIGNWSVTAHVKEAKDGLKFNKVVGGEMMMGIGIDFDLVIDASTADGQHGKYAARVHEKDWSEGITLLSFKAAK